ncbi:diguanylate cyclase domain-containing protein [Natranaerobius trueperi]|uniref:Diguanylate cyclase n=1 Tax=Natranaerobius trueperi TaxID=759412 RepID=A0A226BZG7_9FIRM|nr:diguanylate cyclase [Natranaerobius trueperi]OWZ84438.1 hypothetical protein CDO51_02735 [Natranaerobius trueperi]
MNISISKNTSYDVQTILNSIKSNICLLDEEGNIEYVNTLWLSFAKDNNAEIEKVSKGYNYLEVCDNAKGSDKDTAKQVAAGIRSVINGEKEEFEIEYPCHSPSIERWYLARVAPYSDLKNTTKRKVVISHDNITERKKAERDFINLVENSPDMVVRHDTTSKLIYANSVIEKELGISKDFLIGKTYDEAYQKLKGEIDINDHLYQQFKKKTNLIKQSAQTKEGQEVYYELMGKHLHSRIVPEVDENGKVNTILVITRDVTKQKQDEKKLHQTKNLLEGLFESIQDGISVLNFDLSIRYTNKTIKTWYESDLPLEGKKCYQAYHKREVPCDPCPSIKCLQTGKVEVEEINVQTDIGEMWIELYSYPLFEEGYDEPTGVVEFVRDITDKKQTEERVRYLSFHDTLTGLYNRTYFEEEFKRIDVDRQYPISIIIADIDGLKLVNDEHGHDAGDTLIIEAANLLKSVCRREDIIARWGGDEFVILLPKTDSKTVEDIAGRIISEQMKTNNTQISLSVGVATKENNKQTKEQVFKKADKNMYKHKQNRKKRKPD